MNPSQSGDSAVGPSVLPPRGSAVPPGTVIVAPPESLNVLSNASFSVHRALTQAASAASSSGGGSSDADHRLTLKWIFDGQRPFRNAASPLPGRDAEPPATPAQVLGPGVPRRGRVLQLRRLPVDPGPPATDLGHLRGRQEQVRRELPALRRHVPAGRPRLHGDAGRGARGRGLWRHLCTAPHTSIVVP